MGRIYLETCVAMDHSLEPDPVEPSILGSLILSQILGLVLLVYNVNGTSNCLSLVKFDLCLKITSLKRGTSGFKTLGPHF